MQTAETMDLPLLVRASSDGDQDAWNELVRRYAHLIAAVTRQYRLPEADAQDVCQTVWLRLVEHLGDIREPAALAGWIVTTARHECLRQLRAVRQTVVVDPLTGRDFDGKELGGNDKAADLDGDLLEAERHQVLLDGLAELPRHQREFLVLLAADPPHTYAEISRMLGIPIGSIGPTRSRILDKLRQTNAVKSYLAAGGEATQIGGGRHGHAEVE